MPKESERQSLLKGFDQVLKTLYLDGKENSKDFKEIYELKAGLESTRFLSPKEIIPKNQGMNNMLWQYPAKDFRQIVRMDKRSFVQYVDLIEDHRLFQTTTRNKQYPC